MKTIEEEIWDYIDGGLDAAQSLEIKARIAADPLYQRTYSDLMQVHQMISAEELDEPSMSFTRNIMEKVDLEIAPVALKTKVDQRIIYAIGGFFILPMLSILIYVLLNSSYTMPEFKMPDMHFNLTMSAAATGVLVKAFLFLDLGLAFVYFDRFLRKRIINK
jgi:hypothetical protein